MFDSERPSVTASRAIPKPAHPPRAKKWRGKSEIGRPSISHAFSLMFFLLRLAMVICMDDLGSAHDCIGEFELSDWCSRRKTERRRLPNVGVRTKFFSLGHKSVHVKKKFAAKVLLSRTVAVGLSVPLQKSVQPFVSSSSSRTRRLMRSSR